MAVKYTIAKHSMPLGSAMQIIRKIETNRKITSMNLLVKVGLLLWSEKVLAR